ncbi:hypothetical protein J1614_005912 [Plenodomus biglobosus]|nr:hypothetical protein J1614_005912 [Plenodomus biglobosus]
MSTPNTPTGTPLRSPPTAPQSPPKSSPRTRDATSKQPSHPAPPAQHTRSIWDPEDSEWEGCLEAADITSRFTSRRAYSRPGELGGGESAGADASGYALASVSGALGSMVEGLSLGEDRGEYGSEQEQEQEQEEGQEQDPDEDNQAEQLARLRHAHYSDPNGDLHDDIIRSCFVPGSKYFTYSTTTTPSPRHMNTLNLSAYFTSSCPLLASAKPRLQTAIATLLSHTSRACITAFLDPRTEEFVYRREIECNKAGLILVVRRRGNGVVAGAYRNFGFKLQWVAYVKAVVGVMGEWYEVYAATGPGYTQIKDGVVAWGEFWPEGGEGAWGKDDVEKDRGGPRRLALAGIKKKEKAREVGMSPVEPKFMLYQSRVLSRALLWDIWARFEALNECRATWEADGVVTDVRLQRTLLGFGDEDDE